MKAAILLITFCTGLLIQIYFVREIASTTGIIVQI